MNDALEAAADVLGPYGGDTRNVAAAVVRAYLDALDLTDVAMRTAHGWDPSWRDDIAAVFKAIRP